MAANSAQRVGGILLAAGGSSRLGRPKQLLKCEGKTLIRRAAETLVESGCEPIVVVLGAEVERSTAELDDLVLNLCINENWQEGMSSSIVAGLISVLDIEPDLNAVVILLCDQPRVGADKINALISKFRDTDAPIVAAEYGSTLGVPALFKQTMFDGLRGLTGDKGARDLIRDSGNVAAVKMPESTFDIDTLDDIYTLTNALDEYVG